eukprot:214728-Pyramimonas_sp.AAC.1
MASDLPPKVRAWHGGTSPSEQQSQGSPATPGTRPRSAMLDINSSLTDSCLRWLQASRKICLFPFSSKKL